MRLYEIYCPRECAITVTTLTVSNMRVDIQPAFYCCSEVHSLTHCRNKITQKPKG